MAVEKILNFADYPRRFWQISVGQNSDSGYVSSDLDDLAQSIQIICLTKKGSDPGRPGFGCDALYRIDSPINSPGIMKGALEIREAIKTWETRVIVNAVIPVIQSDKVTYTVNWSPISDQFNEVETSIEFPPMVGNSYFSSNSSTESAIIFNQPEFAIKTTFATWQPSINDYGKIVQGLGELSQSIILILTTVPGTDPGRPSFGCGLFEYIDRPINQAGPKIASLMRTALKNWEPRIQVKKVKYSYAGNNSGLPVLDTLVFEVFWTLAGGDLINGTSSITIGPGPGDIPAPTRRRILGTSTLIPILTGSGEKILING